MWSPPHVGRRESPPGEGDLMDGVEYSTLSEGSSIQQQEYLTTSEASNEQQHEEADESFGNNSSEGEDNDAEQGWEQILELDPDNPPVRNGGNATTIGFEFELLVAAARAREEFPDPHPTDHRWLSDHLINRDTAALSFKYTMRNKIIDQLNAGGVTAHKTKEHWYDELLEGFEWWDSLEYENPNQNDQIVLNWVGKYEWNGFETDDANIHEAVRVLRRQFIEYHRNNNIELYMTTQAVIMTLRDNLFFMIEGLSTDIGRRNIVQLWYDSVSLLVRKEKRRHYSASGDYRDPNSVAMKISDPTYGAWSCTDDISIMDPIATYDDYKIPAGSVPLVPNSNCTWADPPDLYSWFGAEVISSVLDYDNPLTREALKAACKTLRGELRIHKPVPAVHTGVHIHIGQQAGWTLLHLKKFATIWHLIEPDMYRLHRRDRKDNFWCSPMTRNSNLASYIFRGGSNSRYQATTTGPLRRAYRAQMQNWVPPIERRPKLLEYFTNIWQYANIRDLDTAMGCGALSQTCIRWRIQGDKLSDEAGPFVTIQTLEFRLMQGTFDADHVWRWASICERLVIFARDSTPEAFRDTIQHLLDGNFPILIGLNQADIDWFRSRARGDYFAYPELDEKVDWTDPFMIRGYGDTHDDALN
ncbi:hypothetical protein CHU98_g5337 [Xylaria longipes]|nr:hypothetical protein CHU98_g5337 [Xylaria longipes]